MKRCLSPLSVLAWCLWLIVSGTALADQPRPLDLYEGDSHYLNPNIMLLNDPGGTLTIEDILKPEINDQFKKPASDWLSFGFTTDYKWLKVVLNYPDGAPNRQPVKEWFLEVARIQMNVAELYILDDKGHVEMLSADMRKPFEKRAIKHVHSVFPLKTHLGHSYTLYLRLAKDTAFYAPVTLWTPEAFIEKNKIEQLLHGMFYGGMLVMILYNVFVYYSTGDRNYLRYIAYLISVTVFEFVDLGHGINLIPGGHAYLNSMMLPGIMLVSMIIGLHFARHSLEFPSGNRFVDRCLLTWMAIIAINIPSCFLLSYNVVIEGAAMIATLSLGIITFLSLYAWSQKNENAMFFTLAWAFNVGGFAVLSGMSNGHLAPTPFIIAMAPAGVFMEAVMFSFVLAERIKRIERAELDANERAVTNLKRFRSVFDNALEGIFQMSLKGRITTANRAFARMMGYDSPLDATQNSIVIRQRLFPEPLAMLTELAGQDRLQREVRYLDSSGRDRLARLTVQLIRHASGEPTHIEGTFVDFTERLERDKMQKERLRERRERQLAKQATDEKSRFLKSISYEIRTPLAAIMGFSETLKVSTRDEPERKFAIDTIMRNSQRLLRLINDILDFSKLEAGKMPIEQMNVQVADWLADILQRGEQLARQKGIGFTLKPAYPLPDVVTGDSLRLRQMTDNLLLHAIDVTDDGRVLVEIHWDNATRSLCLSCHDDGPAFSDRQRRRMFQSFEDSDTVEGRTAVLRSGLGTVIAAQLVQAMGGSVSAHRLGDRGTRIDVSLPLPTTPHEQWLVGAGKEASAPEATKKPAVPVLQGSILLAEDNTVNQQLIQRIIRKTGATVVVVGDGQQALDKTLSERFDLVLMDVNMPVMGGLEATARLRANGYSGPVYALTAEQADNEIQACLDAGCNGHLGKPLELDKFYAVLTKELSSAGNDLRQTGLH